MGKLEGVNHRKNISVCWQKDKEEQMHPLWYEGEIQVHRLWSNGSIL